jgi:hypothetical protein
VAVQGVAVQPWHQSSVEGARENLIEKNQHVVNGERAMCSSRQLIPRKTLSCYVTIKSCQSQSCPEIGLTVFC